MATCPECDAEIEVDEFDVDKGDQLSCPECGSNLEVIGLLAARARPRARRRRRGRRRRRLEDDDDEDDDEDDDDEDEDEKDEDCGGMIDKERALRDTLSSLGSVVVAYSGGVDSAYLACIATTRSATARVAVTADSPSYPERHRQLAHRRSPREFGLRHEIIQTGELERPEYRANPTNRCYFCKHELYTHLSRIAAERGAVVVDGNNADDRGDYRPGRQAAREFGVRSPLDEVDLDQGRNPRAVAPRRSADLGRAGVGVPVVAHSVSHRSDRREAADDRARRAGAARARLPRLPRPAPRRARAHRNRPRRDAARARARRWPRRSSAR